MIAIDNGVTPLWVANNDRADLIDRAPWARVDDMPWREIVSGSEMVIRGGYRHLQVWRCLPNSPLHCPDTQGSGHCDAIHAEWFLSALGDPPKPPVVIEDLVLNKRDRGQRPRLRAEPRRRPGRSAHVGAQQ